MSTIDAIGYVNAGRYLVNKSTMVVILPGTDSIAYGVYAGTSNSTTGNYNVFIGNYAGTSNTDGDYNVAVGPYAFYSNTGGSNNTATGSYALYSNTSGSGNTANGYSALHQNTNGMDNTATGYHALYSNTTGNSNTATGFNALLYNTTGNNNTASGYEALYYNQTGSQNSVFGYRAGGRGAGGVNSFSSSTIMGAEAGYNITTGSNNTLYGWRDGYNITTGTGNIIIGYNINTPAPDTNNYLSIGNLIFAQGGFGEGTTVGTGNVGISSATPSYKLVVSSGAGESGTIVAITTGTSEMIRMTGAGEIYAKKFIGDGTQLSGIATLTNVNLYYFIRADGSKNLVNAGIMQGDGANDGITVVASSMTVNNTTLFKSSVVIDGGMIDLIQTDTSESYSLKVGTGTTAYHLVVSTTGNVGIGTTGPVEKLEVNGGVKVSSGIVTNKWVISGCENPNDPNDIMVPVGPWCVDKYEASVWSSPTGGTQYGANSDNYPCNDNGQDCANTYKIYARSVSGVMPSRYITWFQANIACINSGKELLPNAIWQAAWQAAASGTTDPGAGTAPNCNVSGSFRILPGAAQVVFQRSGYRT